MDGTLVKNVSVSVLVFSAQRSNFGNISRAVCMAVAVITISNRLCRRLLTQAARMRRHVEPRRLLQKMSRRYVVRQFSGRDSLAMTTAATQ